jgi:hypothetical protein
MEIVRDDQTVSLRMTSEEARLLSFAIRAGFETVSRPEYWIRHGLAQPSAQTVAGAIYEVATGKKGSISAKLEAGIEAIENPRRPRPS